MYKNIRRAMFDQNRTMEGFSEELGMSYAAFRRVLCGETVMSVPLIKQIARSLNKSVVWLMETEEKDK